VHCDSYPVRLDTVRDVLAKYHRTSQEDWRRAQELPEYARPHQCALGLLGPEECGETGRLCWHVATHGNDDPAQRGRIRAWELSSGEAFVEFRLDNFPDVGMFHEMKGMVVQNIEYRAFSMVAKVTYESILQIQVEVTLQELDKCLRELHAARAEQAWSWSSSPTPGKAVRTRLALCPGGVVFQGGQIWYVEALDLSSETELATPFCTIAAGPRPGLDDWRSVICWPDWREVVPAPYPEYLWALTGELQQRGIIQDRPAWLTEPERVKIPRTARQTTAEPAAGARQTGAVPTEESASGVGVLPPVERSGTGEVAAVPPAIDAPQDDWFAYYDHVTDGKRRKPESPGKDAPIDVWFHWYHYVRDIQEYRMTLKKVSDNSGSLILTTLCLRSLPGIYARGVRQSSHTCHCVP